MASLETVKKFTIEVGVTIREYDGQYDWCLSNGEESDELFDSIAEAERDVRYRF